jgi:Ca2+-binding RTX toxin-like protein
MNMIENLESRQMMSVSAVLEGTKLHVIGDGNNNDIYVERIQDNGYEKLRVKDHGNTVKIQLGGSSTKLSALDTYYVNDIFIEGKGGDDKLALSSGNSTGVYHPAYINGGSGNDTIRGGRGADTLIGGSDTDTVDYSKYSADVEIRLNTEASGASGRFGSSTDRDTLKGFENAKGGKGDDWIYGNNGKNKLWGGEGHDVIYGGGEEDRLYGDAGDDSFDLFENSDKTDKVEGGSGHDVVYEKRAKDELKSVEVWY